MVKLIIVILMKEIVKRHYLKPHMAVYYIESPQLLAGSATGEPKLQDYGGEEWVDN